LIVDGKRVYQGPLFSGYDPTVRIGPFGGDAGKKQYRFGMPLLGEVSPSYPSPTLPSGDNNPALNMFGVRRGFTRGTEGLQSAPTMTQPASPATARSAAMTAGINKILKEVVAPNSKEYKIKKGDTLSRIAVREGVTVDDLVKINGIEDKNKIYAGDSIIIPKPEEVEQAKEFVLRVSTRGDEDPDAQFYSSFTQGITPKSMTQQTGAGTYETADDMTELEILARTIEKEAEGESKKGKLAVGATIKNRVDKQSWMGKDIKSVILKRGQFSPWNSYTNYAEGRQGKDMLGESAKPSKDSYEAAKKILSGDYIDPTGGATHFVNPKEKEDVSWYEPFVQNKPLKIGNHQFGSPDDPTWDLQSSPRPKARPLGRP